MTIALTVITVVVAADILFTVGLLRWFHLNREPEPTPLDDTGTGVDVDVIISLLDLHPGDQDFLRDLSERMKEAQP